MRNGIDGGEVHEAHTLTARLGTYGGMHVHDKCMTKMLTKLDWGGAGVVGENAVESNDGRGWHGAGTMMRLGRRG